MPFKAVNSNAFRSQFLGWRLFVLLIAVKEYTDALGGFKACSTLF